MCVCVCVRSHRFRLTEPHGRPVGVLKVGMSLSARSTALALNTCSEHQGQLEASAGRHGESPHLIFGEGVRTEEAT